MAQKSNILNASEAANIEKAAEILKNGGLVAFPTETVYGLGVDALNAKAVAKAFEVKKRPSFDPLILHIAKAEEANALWKETPKIAQILMKQFWPGPLTIVLPKSDLVPDIVTSGLPTVAVRMPDCQVAQQLIGLLGRPVAAPSANLFGYTSPTTARAVSEDLGDEIDLILDGGPTTVGIESTVLKIEGTKCFLLRPGGVPVEEIEKFVPVQRESAEEKLVHESPGLAQSHYAPWTPFALMDKSYPDFIMELKRLNEVCQKSSVDWPRIGLLVFDEKADASWFETVEVLSPKKDLHEAAANLFHAIRKLDKMNLDLIIAEMVPEKGIGLAIMDRLRKATGGKLGIKRFFAGGEL